MKLPRINVTKYTLEDLKTLESVKREGNLKLRKRIDILVIDDEEFTPGNFLDKNHFSLTYKTDIDNVKDVSEYPIIMCDIRGVGGNLSKQYEGAYLIKEIKQNYPDKRVIAYTASQYDPSYNKYLNYADELLQKGTSLEDWVTILDEQINKAVDPIYQWCVFRNALLNNGVVTIDVAKMESDFVEACKEKDFDSFEKKAQKFNGEVKNLVVEILSSSAVKLIKGVL